MSKVLIEVDGKTLEVEAGQMLITATDAAGIHIPRFCYHPKLSIAANCRMCLVDVENAPKPLPACATPIADGMKVQTQSERATTAQSGTMEFLLINHPLDCPICDQGGECPLQDQSIEYGANASRYHEPKRQVASKDIGPLIATWMTRCIHCTRCVRYGDEIAGVMEMGAFGRGEHTKIGTFPGQTDQSSDIDSFLTNSVDSEISGNVIDLCPVGALTAKPSKYAARIWEMKNHPSISPHDCVGANISIQTLRGEIMRTVPRDNAAINQEWLADRDRFSYEAVIEGKRLQTPMIKDGHGWREVDWETAFKHASAGLKTVINRYGADQIGGLVSPAASLEEFYLFQKLLRGLGSQNIDHRLRNEDFSGDDAAPLYPGTELPIAEFENLGQVLLVGSNVRKEQPLLGLFLRQAATKNGCQISALNTVDYDFHFDLHAQRSVTPSALFAGLADIAAEVANRLGIELDERIGSHSKKSNEPAKAMAKSLCAESGQPKAVILGATAQQHPDAANLQAAARWIADHTGAKLVILPEANSAAAWAAGAVPHRGLNGEVVTKPGLNARQMLVNPLHAYVLLGIEPGLDTHRQDQALQAMIDADFVVQFAAFMDEDAINYADVLLPIGSYAESSGSYINCEGQLQTTVAAAAPVAEARPSWKVLRVLANFLNVPGFDYIDLNDVRDEISLGDIGIIEQRGVELVETPESKSNKQLQRIVDTPIYRVDATVRHADALQRTADNPGPIVGLNQNTADQLDLGDATMVAVEQGKRSALLPLVVNDRWPDGCVYIPSAYRETASLSGTAPVTVSVPPASAAKEALA